MAEPPRDGSTYRGYLREDAGNEDWLEAGADDDQEPGLRLRPAYRAPAAYDPELRADEESPSELRRLFRG